MITRFESLIQVEDHLSSSNLITNMYFNLEPKLLAWPKLLLCKLIFSKCYLCDLCVILYMYALQLSQESRKLLVCIFIFATHG